MKTNNNIPAYRFQGYTDAWDLRKLGEIFQVSSGQTPSRQDEENFSSPDVPWVKTLDLTNSAILESEEFISNKASQKLKLFPNGTVLIAMYGGLNQIGRTGLLTFPSTINQAISALPPSDEILPYYLIYHLNSKIGVWRSLAASSRKDPNITKTDVENFKISFPALPEQEAIGTFFSTLDRHITLHQRKLDTLKEQKKTYLKLLIPAKGQTKSALRFQGFEDDWEEVKLGDVTEKFDNLRVPITASKRISGNTPYYGANGIQDYVEGYTHDGEFILIAEDGANDLKDYPVQYVNGKVWVNNHAHVIQSVRNFASNLFLLRALKTIDIEMYLVGGGRAKLNGDVMMKLPFKIPSLPEQEAIGTFFQTLDQELAQVEDKLASLKEMKKTLLRKLFV
ncbi:restriction endonuclease subunit S [Streptococcus suis]|nr:restriction endonuclease subunit S [Streptococcus suis]